jgi:hypothetical protein
MPGGALLARLIQSLGLPTHDAAPDGAVFAEVHTPQEIRTRLPGTAMPPTDKPVLAEVGWKRREEVATTDSAARLRDLDQEMAFIVEKLMTPAYLEHLSLARLISLAAATPDEAHLGTLYRVLLRSKVGARASAGQQGLPTAKLEDGTLMLVALCNIPAMAEANPGVHFFEIAALDVLAMADSAGYGVILENALDGRNSWVGIAPKQVTQLLFNAQRTA